MANHFIFMVKDSLIFSKKTILTRDSFRSANLVLIFYEAVFHPEFMEIQSRNIASHFIYFDLDGEVYHKNAPI